MARKNNSPVKFHGAFTEKDRAEKRASKVGGRVREIKVNGHPRFTVYTDKEK